MNNTAQVTPAFRRVMHARYVAAYCARAMANGGRQVSLMTWEWDCSGGCHNPVYMELEGRWDVPVNMPDEYRDAPEMETAWYEGKFYFRDLVKLKQPLGLQMQTPCRKCPACLARRAHHWRMRAESETRSAAVTWFGTMTCTPHHHAMAAYSAERRMKSRGVPYSELSAEQEFLASVKELNLEVTKYLKRVRKETGASLRYICVVEAHKSGLPHFHMLIHEPTTADHVPERTLRRQWTFGHSMWKIVRDRKAVSYVCKYLSKQALARVRASVAYGKNDKRPNDIVQPERRANVTTPHDDAINHS